MRKRLAPPLLVLFLFTGCSKKQSSNNPAPSGSAPPRVSLSSLGGSRDGSEPQILSYSEVVDRASPAVVTIRAARRVRAPEQFPFSRDLFFRRFFGNLIPGGPEGEAEQVEHSLGSGVIVRTNGNIMTNHHVIDGAEDIKVDLNNKTTYSAKLVGTDPPSDLAVLKVSGTNLPVLALADSDGVRVGDVCLALGNPLGVGQTVTSGIVSAKSRSTGLSNGTFEDFLQTDAPINRGNSGGPLVNTTGEVIGINSQILSPTGTSIGIGFAIPSNMAKNVFDQLLTNGKVRRGQLGVGIQAVTSDLAAGLGLKEGRGVLVSSVMPGGPAEKAGIRPGDVITAIDGTPVDDPNAFRNRIATTPPGTTVTLAVLRDGREQQIQAKLAELTAESARTEQFSKEPAGEGQRLGIAVEPLTREIAQQLGIGKGTQGLVVRDVDPAGPAADAGIQPGDVIVQVNRQPVRSPSDMLAALKRSGSRPAVLLINRGGQNLFLTVKTR